MGGERIKKMEWIGSGRKARSLHPIRQYRAWKQVGFERVKVRRPPGVDAEVPKQHEAGEMNMSQSKKMGPPCGNKNALRHGLSSLRGPVGTATITRSIGMMQRSLEAAVLKARATVEVSDAALIQTACRWEWHSQLAARWLRVAFGELTYDERLRYSRETARASSERDKAIGQLRLGGDMSTPWGPMLGDLMGQPGPLSIVGPDASGDPVGDLGGSDDSGSTG